MRRITVELVQECLNETGLRLSQGHSRLVEGRCCAASVVMRKELQTNETILSLDCWDHLYDVCGLSYVEGFVNGFDMENKTASNMYLDLEDLNNEVRVQRANGYNDGLACRVLLPSIPFSVVDAEGIGPNEE